jgi:nucleoside-diphosphate-sugar epimerase
VFHLATAFRRAGAPDDYYRLVHRRSTELLAEESSRQPRFARFVHVSTVGVLGHIENPPADETWPLAPGDIYQATKAEAEEWIRAQAPRLGLSYAIIRPCAIYGPADTRLLKIFQMAARGVLFALGTGRTLYHLVHIEDLVAILERAASHPSAEGEVFIAGADRATRLDDMARMIGQPLGRRVRVVTFPAGPVFLLAGACEALCRPLGLQPPLYRRRVAFFTKDRSFDTKKLREVLGYRSRYSVEDGLAMTARWYAEHGWIRAPRT